MGRGAFVVERSGDDEAVAFDCEQPAGVIDEGVGEGVVLVGVGSSQRAHHGPRRAALGDRTARKHDVGRRLVGNRRRRDGGKEEVVGGQVGEADIGESKAVAGTEVDDRVGSDLVGIVEDIVEADKRLISAQIDPVATGKVGDPIGIAA